MDIPKAVDRILLEMSDIIDTEINKIALNLAAKRRGSGKSRRVFG